MLSLELVISTIAAMQLIAVISCEEISCPVKSPDEKNTDYWVCQAKQEIEEAKFFFGKEAKAKNIIIFIGDGMGITASTAGRIYKGQKKSQPGEECYLTWEKFTSMGLLKTFCLDKQVPDSASTATALFCGVKTNGWVVGNNGHVTVNDCSASLKNEHRVDSVLQWAQNNGKETGIVTTTFITHATPSALYSHSASRRWECDSSIKAAGEKAQRCKDITRQLVEDYPGRDIKVILGGGRQQMGMKPIYQQDPEECARDDGRDLVKEWQEDKKIRGQVHAFVTNNEEFRRLDIKNAEFILGLFSENHMPYHVDRDAGPRGTPSLREMTEAAISRLQTSEKGYFLMVESGRIDHGLHETKPKRALEEIVAMDEAVESALKMTDPRDTLIIVTADHSHVMTINGYPDRGNDILGTSKYEYVMDDMPHTTLMFTNGPAANFTWNGQKVLRSNLTGVNTKEKDFMSQSAVPTKNKKETHGGEDVAVYATGPMSHLFHRLHEQSYVAHAMGYAACINPYIKCENSPMISGVSSKTVHLAFLFGSVLICKF